MFALEFTPLCPAGHLPHKGGEQMELAHRHEQYLSLGHGIRRLLFSPLVREMSGRAEGGISHG